ncbi:RNA-binding domain-containing protein [Rhodanobacter sp. Col0626]|uniref:ATP-binding protein n=1 Tax=Rhodanobacter sp. Col0626 TaxID=3415679 RepID=UPI003CF14679
MEWIVSAARAVEKGRLPDEILAKFSEGDFCATESFCLDFKRDGYSDDAESMAEAVKDIASFYNTYGGFIVFGIAEVEKDVRYHVSGISGTPFNMQLLRGKVESWLTCEIFFTYEEYEISDSIKIGVICIPKRKLSDPNRFKRRGPEISKGKYAFDAGNVAVRQGDKSTLATEMVDWQLVLSDRTLDKVAGELGRLVLEKRSGARLDHNLPSRDVICTKFVGRTDVLTELWAWLNDQFQYAKVIAGEGGKGKTSVGYEFATQVAYMAPLSIERIVWLTAKKRQFSGFENLWRTMPETHFNCFRTMLVAIGRNVGYLDGELSEASDAELSQMVRSGVSTYATLFVLDDVDSLEPNDQRRALEFAQQAGSDGVRFLLTTRSNASYSSSAAITLKGLEGDEYADLVEILATRYSVTLPKNGVDLLAEATKGSPLLTDSILRVVRRGNNLRRAIDDWKGHSGDDARNAVLGREIEHLSRPAMRVLLCLAFMGECSKSELMSASGLLEIGLEDALDELQSLFIVNAPKIIQSEPRFDVGVSTALLVISKRNELAGDHVALERKIREARSKVKARTSQDHNKDVAIAISQALALRNRDISAARQTIDAALKTQKNHPDLLLFKARMICETDPAGIGEARKLFAQAYQKGARKHVLFDLWYQCERDASFGPGVIEVALNALKEFPGEDVLWGERKAEGYVINGINRSKNREFDQAYDELSAAAKELFLAKGKASASKEAYLLDLLHGLHDLLLSTMPSTTNTYRADAVSLIRELTDRGDYRFEVLDALTSALLQRASEIERKVVSGESQKIRFENNRNYVLDILRNAGARASDLFRQVSDIS